MYCRSPSRGGASKGHVVRRDDVCWGRTFADIQMANGDTFHVTNCSPQIKAFNQGRFGAENWGDLEDHVKTSLGDDAERACIFAGPVLDPGGLWFRGSDGAGEIRVQVPSAYWKIVVVRGRREPPAFGFLLTQDVRPITEDEFSVSEEWIGSLKPLPDIASRLGGWVGLDKVPLSTSSLRFGPCPDGCQRTPVVSIRPSACAALITGTLITSDAIQTANVI